MIKVPKELNTAYNPKTTEERIYKLWEKSGFFNPDNLKNAKKPFTITIPPPNITGTLHMGHALNIVIQDILIRFKRMAGFKTLWVPGTDHAGIATQSMVEKKLKKEGKTRLDLGREKFVEEIWKWKNEYGNKILDQLKRLGASCDWSRARFTMDKDYSAAVLEAFVQYYNQGWIYRGERVVNWCPRCQTSLSDLELEYKKEKGKLYYIKYPLVQTTNYKLQTLKLGDSNKVQLGENVLAFGSPLGNFPNTVSEGIISGLHRKIKAETDLKPGKDTLKEMIQTDAAINPGNSGGPLINMKGEVIGINTVAVANAENISLAIPINPIKKFLKTSKHNR